MDNLQNFRRTDYCGTFSAANVGQEISVCGWVQRQRNLGGLIFVDLRDRTGLLQLSFDDSTPRDIFEKAASLRGEYVIAAKGLVRERESKNPDLTDDWVASNLGETMNLNTIDELNDFVKNTMLYDQQASTVYSALHDKVSFAKELPQSVLDYYRDVVLYRVYSYAKNYGTTMTTLLKSGLLGTSYDSIDAYLEDIQGSLNTITEQALLMQAIAEKQGLVCDTALMNQDFGKFYGTTDPSAYISSYGENYIKMNVLQSEVMQGLIDNIKYK